MQMIFYLFIISIFIISSVTIIGQQQHKGLSSSPLYWQVTNSGPYMFFMRLKAASYFAEINNRPLVILTTKGIIKDFRGKSVNVCQLIKLPSSSSCQEHLPTNHSCLSTDQLCIINGSLNETNTLFPSERSYLWYLLDKTNYQLQFQIQYKNHIIDYIKQIKTMIGLSHNSNDYAVVYWKRDQSVKFRCSEKKEISPNCESAQSLIIKIRSLIPFTTKIIIITNEPDQSKRSLLNGRNIYLLSGFAELSGEEYVAMETYLVLNARILLAWGPTDYNDVFQQARSLHQRSYCIDQHLIHGLNWCNMLQFMNHNTSLNEYSIKKKNRNSINTNHQRSTTNTSILASIEYLNIIARRHGSGKKLEKRIHSNHTRLLLVAGLEGTGHHAIASMLKACVRMQRCEPAKALSRHLMNHTIPENQLRGLFGAEQESFIAANLERVEKLMYDLTKTPGDHLYFLGQQLGDLSSRSTGMLSYPNYGFKFKTLDHPDLYILAVIAEVIGIDFRILVMQRGAAATISSINRRGFSGISQRKNLLDNAASLYTQLYLIDRRFYHCLDYTDLSTLSDDGRQQLVKFLHPNNLKDSIQGMLREVKDTRGYNKVIPKHNVFTIAEDTKIADQNAEMMMRLHHEKKKFRKAGHQRHNRWSFGGESRALQSNTVFTRKQNIGRNNTGRSTYGNYELPINQYSAALYNAQLEMRLALIDRLCAREPTLEL